MVASGTRAAPARAWGAWIFVCVVWGTTYLGIRIALETVPPMLMAGLRWVTAGFLLLAVLAAGGHPLPSPGSWASLMVLGVLMTTLGNGGVVWAEQTISSGLAALLVAAVPFWMVGVERFRADAEPVPGRRIAGLLVGFAGIALLVWPEISSGQVGSAAGVAATQIACVGWAIGSSYSRRRAASDNVVASAALQMIFGGLALLLVGTLLGEWPALRFTGRTLGALVYLIVAGSIGAYSAYLYALKHLPVATVSLYAYVNPVIAVALGAAVLGEPFSPRVVVAGAVVLVGMMLVRQR